ncbi:MAG: Transcriptional regulator [Firmicutes bacterium]|nr:Transcriptional regulator [Bacillota bacterium]
MGFFKKQNTSQAIVDYVLDKINCGELKIGDKLPTERELSEKLEVSRVPIREALCALSVMGILESRQGNGTYVNHFDSGIMGRVFYAFAVLENTQMSEILSVRKTMEAEGARLAADNATNEQIIRMEQILAEYDETLNLSPDSRLFREQIKSLDYSFHYAVAEASHNRYLVQLLSTVTASFRVLHEKSFSEDKDLGLDAAKRFQEVHKKVLMAIKARDQHRAWEAMYEHMTTIENIIR